MYFRLVGDLLLMEIWEYLTQGFHKTNKQQNNKLMLRIEYLPPAPIEERYFELFNINVKSKFILVVRYQQLFARFVGPKFIDS